MKKIITALILLALAGTSFQARGGDFVSEYRNSARVYGGVALMGVYHYYYYTLEDGMRTNDIVFPTSAVYGISLQRDLLPRLSLELDLQNCYLNTFPNIADATLSPIINEGFFGDYQSLLEMSAVRNYIDGKIAEGENPNNIVWQRRSSTSLTLKPVFHMVNKPNQRFSLYAGIGCYISDQLEFKVDCLYPELWPEDYTAYTYQSHIFGLAGNVGVRYERTFAEHYLVGVDLGAAMNDHGARWQNDRTMFGWYDVRALLYVGIRL